MSSRVQSFAPLVTAQSRVLVMGSMPGVESLNAKQYYAHPRNAFWRIMAELFQFSVALDYGARCEALMDSGVGLWDSMRECERPGSLDSAVVDATIEANDFASLFARHGQLRHVFFNGAKSEQVFKRHVLPTLPADCVAELGMRRLPRTSPAHASLNFAQKLSAWTAVRDAMDVR